MTQLTPEQKAEIEKRRASVRLELDINNDAETAEATASRLLMLLKECRDEDLHLRIDFFGIRK